MARTSSSSSSRSSSSCSSYGRSSPSHNSTSHSTSSSKTTPTITSKPSPSPSPSPSSPPPPAPHTSSASTSTQSQPSNKTELGNKSSGGGFMSSVMDGFGFGFGSSIAHRVVGGIFGSTTSYPHTTKVETHHHHHHHLQETHIEDKVLNTQDISKPEYISKPECKSLQEEYLKCIQSSTTDFHSSCDFSLNIFKDCETNSISFN